MPITNQDFNLPKGYATQRFFLGAKKKKKRRFIKKPKKNYVNLSGNFLVDFPEINTTPHKHLFFRTLVNNSFYQRSIYYPVKHLWWGFFAIIVNDQKKKVLLYYDLTELIQFLIAKLFFFGSIILGERSLSFKYIPGYFVLSLIMRIQINFVNPRLLWNPLSS